MRYGMMILVAAAVLAMSVTGYAASIAWRERGGTEHGVTWTDFPSDDIALDLNKASTAGNYFGYVGSSGTTVRAKFWLEGWADLFTQVPATSGGGNIVIDNCVITWGHNSTGNEQVDNLTVFRVTTDWLNGHAPGAIDNYISLAYKNTETSATWANGNFSTADYTETNKTRFDFSGVNNSSSPANVTQLMQDMYDNGTNTGFMLARDDVLNTATAKPAGGEAGGPLWSFYGRTRPRLQMEYHYEAPIPEPGTLLLLGTGVLGTLGYLGRRRMK